jgi:hypothetical protein
MLLRMFVNMQNCGSRAGGVAREPQFLLILVLVFFWVGRHFIYGHLISF